MAYYIIIENNKIYSSGEYPVEAEGFTNVEVTKEFHDNYVQNPDRYMWNGKDVVLNPDYEEMQANKRREQFSKDFFQTSLGWIRRKPTLADGTEDDFLNNDLPLLAIGLMTGSNPVLPIAYQTPDFTQEFTTEYMESLQVKNQPVTQQFIAECSAVKMKDFTG